MRMRSSGGRGRFELGPLFRDWLVPIFWRKYESQEFILVRVLVGSEVYMFIRLRDMINAHFRLQVGLVTDDLHSTDVRFG